jgi:two-component system response regulator PilR (NtrC family)
MNVSAPLTTPRSPIRDVIPGGAIRSLMVVDDDPSLLDLWSKCFEHAGYKVATFNSFQDARRYLAAHRPDAILTDIRLGAYNGLQLVLVAKSMYPTITAAVVTGYDDPVLRKDAVRYGAAFLTKPVSAHAILDFLRSRT